MQYFITAIGTDSGKTFFSAILTEMLMADYWKPIQAGLPRDTETVKSLVTNPNSRFFNERYLLNTPASPHASARIDGVEIKLGEIIPPSANHDLVIEGAGGLMVPVNDDELMIDLIKKLDCETILVSNLYLGSINHTLLSIEALKNRGISVKGIVFNGVSNPESERVIEAKSGWPVLLRIDQEAEVSPEVVMKYAVELRKSWK